MVNDSWLPVVDVHVKADSMTAASSSWELVHVLPLAFMVANTSGCAGGPPIITAAAAPFPVSSELIHWCVWYSHPGMMQYVLACTGILKQFHQLDQQQTSNSGNKGWNMFLMRSTNLSWGRWKMVDYLMVCEFNCQKCWKIIGIAMETAMIEKMLRDISS